MSLPTEPPTPPTRTTEALRSELREVNAQLESMKRAWEDEKRKLLGENAVLQDAATRLNVEVRNAKDEIRKFADAERLGEKARAGIQAVSIARWLYSSPSIYIVSCRNSTRRGGLWLSWKQNSRLSVAVCEHSLLNKPRRSERRKPSCSTCVARNL